MLTFIKIAWRNIIRNKKRSLITIGAVGFGLGALIFLLSFVEGAHRQMIENYTSLVTGHIQIHVQGFQQTKKLELNIPQADLVMDKLKKIPEVKTVSTRVKSVGLISSSESSSGVAIVGIQPEQENKISSIYKRLRSGRFLTDQDHDGILIGADLAKSLNVNLGDKTVIMSQALDGSIAAGAYYIKGIFSTGTEEVDQGMVFITLPAAQELYVMPNAVSEITVNLSSAQDASISAAKIRQILNSKDLEVLSWKEISPSFQQWIEFDVGFMWIIVGIVTLVAAIGILNTVLMGVLERTREFGILLALGTKRNEIIAIVGWESIFLAVVGSFIGIILGAGLTYFFNQAGIDLTLFTKALNSLYIDAVVYPIMNIHKAVTAVILILLSSIFASVYPAWYAASLKPMEAIRRM